jgi:hypothetical protein
VPLEATHFGKPQILGIAPQRRLLHLRFKIVRKLSAELGFDGLARFAIRHAEKTCQHLF